MISKVDIKSMLGYGYERELGLGCKLLGDQNKIVGAIVSHYNEKKNCGHWCRPLQGKKLLWVPPLDLKKQEP
jgi:hypothetical protein